MKYFEIIHLRSYSQADSNDAVEAFHQLTFPDQEKGKSPLGLQLAAAFSYFGKIDHSMWVREDRVPLDIRRNDYEEQK